MELVKRKNTRLQEFDYSSHGTYFVTICTNNHECLFGAVVGDGSPVPKVALNLQGDVIRQYINRIPEKYPAVRIDNAIIMPNHVHMIVTISSGTGNPSPTLGAIIGWFKYQATKQINLLHHTVGQKCWQRSYYDHVIRGEEDYRKIWEYIDQNPLKWELTNHH